MIESIVHRSKINNMKILNRRSKEHGFTLIELLVVVAIIGLLSSIVLARIQTVRAKANDTARVSLVKQYMNALELMYTNTGGYPTDLDGATFIEYCLGAGSTQCTYISNIDETINTSLNTYIKGPPQSTHPMIIPGDTDNYKGIAYMCVDNPGEIINKCQGYALHYIVSKPNDTCLNGTTPTPDEPPSNYTDCYTTNSPSSLLILRRDYFGHEI